ncbi:N-acetylmuramoyl-L-alanine amidase family protein [Lysinibacillus halotolerans]|uniref:N-acetylmuramoyl-L-alanine amidase n=1 Tax=Lysinibacillus halotolerans TaxID=1368476 RepID=A0A3M8H1C3_9BACI|nr:N-acetylmuramoyl-L-alanine amidase [Lysinibacillus halotolerans]RNC96258.1 N-acetylmuramoyl-L-alanine amidase [Lysinibacillus halotolerans]
MPFKIALDDGHGMETAGKRTPKFNDGTFMHENEFNRAVVNYLNTELKRCGFITLLTAPTDEDIPLATRVSIANKNKVDAFVSVHANAFTGSWNEANGVEVFVGKSELAKKLGKAVHKFLLQGTKQTDRGVKDGTHLYVIRKTDAPAILTECAFMDNKVEAELLRTDSFRKECAIEIAKGICEAFKVKYVEEKVQVAKATVNRKRHNVRVYWFPSETNSGLVALKKYLDGKKLDYKVTCTNGKYMLESYWYPQDSKGKYELEQWLLKKGFNYDIQLEK